MLEDGEFCLETPQHIEMCDMTSVFFGRPGPPWLPWSDEGCGTPLDRHTPFVCEITDFNDQECG
jgi:hypothetical protein